MCMFEWVNISNGRQLTWHLVLHGEYSENPCLGAFFFSMGWTFHSEFLFHDSVCPLGHHKYYLPFHGVPPTKGGKSSWDLCVQVGKVRWQDWITDQLKAAQNGHTWSWHEVFHFSMVEGIFVQYFPCLKAEEPLLNLLWLKVCQDLQFQNHVMPIQLQKLPWLFEESEF